MLELDKDRFAQLLREAPEKDALFPEPQYSPYIQSLIDRLKEEESLDLAAIDWSAFEMADVTIPFFQDNADDTLRSWIMGLIGRTRTAPIFQSRRRVFFRGGRMYDYEYEADILLFLRLMKFLHTEHPFVLEQIIKDYPAADEENIWMILDELLMTVFDEGAPDEGDDMMTVRFSDERIDRLYTQGCKHSEILPYQINAWQEKIKDVFLFYVAGISYSVFDIRYHFSGDGVKFDITLSPDCYEPSIFLNSIINMILYCKRDLARIESAEAKAQAAHASIRKEAA